MCSAVKTSPGIAHSIWSIHQDSAESNGWSRLWWRFSNWASEKQKFGCMYFFNIYITLFWHQIWYRRQQFLDAEVRQRGKFKMKKFHSGLSSSYAFSADFCWISVLICWVPPYSFQIFFLHNFFSLWNPFFRTKENKHICTRIQFSSVLKSCFVS